MPTDPTSQRLIFRSAIRSDVGSVRENNEDSVYARDDFLVLADGMGGHSSGEVASAIAVHTFAAAHLDQHDSFGGSAADTRVVLRAMSSADETLRTMGTTVVALGRINQRFHACHIGDSRIYILRDGALEQVTTDHTHVQHLVELGRITREQISTHPYRAMLLKSLDDQPGGAEPDSIEVDLREGDRVLLCSDGLSDYVSEWVLRDILRKNSPDEAADALIAAALHAGTRDNISVIVADLVTNDQGAAPSFAGAAAEPMILSAAAETALRESAPGFSGPLATDAEIPAETLTNTGLLPITPDAPPALRVGPLLLALGALGAVVAGIVILL